MDSEVSITPGSGAQIDTRTENVNGQHRQVVVLGDPVENAGVATIDPTYGLGVDIKRVADSFASKITVVGNNTYVGMAATGTAQSSAGWQAKKISVSGGTTTITWADGNSFFDNLATDLTILSYS